MIEFERSHPCVKFLRGPLRTSEGGGGGELDGLEEEKGGEKIMTFFCVVENVGGGVRSHPAVRNLLAVRNTEIELEIYEGGNKGNKP